MRAVVGPDKVTGLDNGGSVAFLIRHHSGDPQAVGFTPLQDHGGQQAG